MGALVEIALRGGFSTLRELKAFDKGSLDFRGSVFLEVIRCRKLATSGYS